jgi:hypothetical protein
VQPTTVRNWLTRPKRPEDELYTPAVYDEPRAGHLRGFEADAYDQSTDMLHTAPTAVGLDARAWSVPLVQQYPEEACEIEYCHRDVHHLVSKVGPSPRSVQPEQAQLYTLVEGTKSGQSGR